MALAAEPRTDTVLQLTRLSGQSFALNPDLIERAEATPDTVVTLVNGSKYVIGETLDDLIELVRAYRADVVHAARSGAPLTAPATTRARGLVRDQARGADAETGTVLVLRTEQGDA
jgi:flagellar protein FlbD